MMRKKTSLIFSFAATVALATTPVVAQETQSWLHVQVEGQGDDTESLAVNVPLRAVGALLAMAPEEIITADGRLTIAEEHGVSVSAIRTMWQEVKAVGDSEFVSFEKDDQTVRVARVGEQLQIRVEGDETVLVDFPLAVVDALLSGDGETLNVAAAIAALGELRGDIVRVTEDDRLIRVWVDERSTQ